MTRLTSKARITEVDALSDSLLKLYADCAAQVELEITRTNAAVAKRAGAKAVAEPGAAE